MSASIRGAWACDRGAIREHNEDACSFVERLDEALAVVADGMGGQSSGEAASKLTVKTCVALFEAREQEYAKAWWHAEHGGEGIPWSELPASERMSIEAHVRALRGSRTASTLGDLAIVDVDLLERTARQAALASNRAILDLVHREPMRKGLASTVALAIFEHGRAALAHVGDSRIYRLRGGELEQLTEDHDLINDYAKTHALTPEQIAELPKNVITRALGMLEDLQVDTRVVATQPGDLFLLCSDGITSTFDDAVLVNALVERRTAAAAHLVEGARTSSQNEDNVAAVVVEVL